MIDRIYYNNVLNRWCNITFALKLTCATMLRLIARQESRSMLLIVRWVSYQKRKSITACHKNYSEIFCSNYGLVVDLESSTSCRFKILLRDITIFNRRLLSIVLIPAYKWMIVVNKSGFIEHKNKVLFVCVRAEIIFCYIGFFASRVTKCN